MSELANSAIEFNGTQSRWPMVVVTPMNLFRESGKFHPTVRRAVQLLIDSDIPIVLVASRAVREAEEVQRELGIVGPYLSGGGTALHVPDGYFGESQRGPSGALEDLLKAYRRHRPDIVIIGFGATWSDRFLLGHVNVRVIVRDGYIDQSQLRQAFPDAFVTNSEGSLGWGEAILGRLAYEADETGMMGASCP